MLITGETGTGKELAARAIHAGSPRGAKPFVALNCAALTESLLENELFGHSRGAFTGAAGARPGLIEHASGGTLFLDEIGTMAPALQAKLLRALDSGEVRRIGENESRRVDVRFVTATNVDIEAAVANGSFRNDLYYRVNVHRVHMPPLREREGDVALLAAHFLDRYGRSAGVTGDRRARRWPRSRRTPTRATCGSWSTSCSAPRRSPQPPELAPADLPEELMTHETPTTAASAGTVTAGRERAEREMLVGALSRCHGEISNAARELQVSRTTMWRLMKKHGIEA